MRYSALPGRMLLPLVLAALAIACGATAPQGNSPQPWEKGMPVSDADFEAMLRPEQAVESAALYSGTDGNTYYVARLQKKPEWGFLNAYEKLIESRGFLVYPVGSSAHYALPRVEAYHFVVFKKGPVRPFTLFYRDFYDSGSKWREDAPLYKNYPAPLTLEDRTLVLRLGDKAIGPWEQTVLVPEEDVVQVKELPFPRLPGAVITRILGPEDEDDLRGMRYVSRSYVVRGSSIEEVLRHYSKVIQEYGIPIRPDRQTANQLFWYSTERPFRGFDQLRVEEDHVVLILGAGAPSVEKLRELAPSLLEDYPSAVLCFQVYMRCPKAETAVPYWTPEDQARREALLAQKKDK